MSADSKAKAGTGRLSHTDVAMMDSDFEESADADQLAAASTSSVGSSSLTSLGSGRHKGYVQLIAYVMAKISPCAHSSCPCCRLAPLAPIHGVAKTAQPSLPNFPATTTGGGKHLAPLGGTSSLSSPKKSTLPESGKGQGSRSFGASEDKLSSGSALEQSVESIEEDLKSGHGEDDGALSPFDKRGGRALGDEDQALEMSGAVESSFEESSYAENDAPMGRNDPMKRYVKSVEVGARGVDALSDDEVSRA